MQRTVVKSPSHATVAESCESDSMNLRFANIASFEKALNMQSMTTKVSVTPIVTPQNAIRYYAAVKAKVVDYKRLPGKERFWM